MAALWRRKNIWVPTGPGWIAILLLVLLTAVLLIRNAYTFLAINRPLIGAQILVVEGWMPDYALRSALDEFQRGGYQTLITTGGPVETGSYLVDFDNFAEVAAATLEDMGMDEHRLEVAPSPKVKKDRTLVSARCLEQWLRAKHPEARGLTVVTVGPHARRTRLLFSRVLSPRVEVGVLAVEPEDYEPARWWTSSAGVRTVVSEVIALLYAWCGRAFY